MAEYKNVRRVAQRIVIVLILLLQISGLTFLSQTTNQGELFEKGATTNEWSNHIQDENQYNHLANAFLNGRIDLDLPVAPLLLEMDNPYENWGPNGRMALNSELHQEIYWDYAYYEGKYYSYFGALPVLTSYLPFKIITGMDLRTDYALIFFSGLFSVAAFFLVRKLLAVYFPGISFVTFIVVWLCFWAGSGVLEQVFLPRIYEVASVSGMFFACAGMACWLTAKEKARTSNKPLSLILLVLGGLFLALTLGCRPQFFIGIFLAVPLFWNEMIHKRQFFSRSGIPATLAIVLPVLLIAFSCALYNYLRFGSPFDFGAAYNLTGADMTTRSVDIIKVLNGLFEYFLLSPDATRTFPFIRERLSVIINEPYYFGYLWMAPFAFFVLSSLFGRERARANNVEKKRENNQLEWRKLAVMAVVFALLVAVVDIVMSGGTMRYFADFAWLIMIVAVLGFARMTPVPHRSKESMETSLHAAPEAFFIGIGSIAFLVGVGMQLWSFFGTERIGALVETNPQLYQFFQSFFW